MHGANPILIKICAELYSRFAGKRRQFCVVFMGGADFDMVLRKEAKTTLQIFKDQSLLRRKFGDSAVALYEAIGGGKAASSLMAELGMGEEQFVEILEYMNNNGMVSIEAPAPAPEKQEQAKPLREAPEGPPGDEGSEREPEEGGVPALPRIRRGKVDEKLLSPLEKILYDSYGEVGVRVYSLIDGEKTAEEILRETSISESKLVEILEFMDERGIIKLEKPTPEREAPRGERFSRPPGGEKGPEESDEEEEEEPKPAREPRFSPITEDVPEGKPFQAPPPPEKPKAERQPPAQAEEPFEDIILVDVPAMNKLSLMQKASMMADLSTKFGKGASELMKLVDGNRDFIELSLSAGLALFEVDEVMAYFGKRGFVNFRQLERPEIKKRYGEDGFSIYKKYGRDGLLLYEMIGKEASLKDIIVKSRVDPERAIDIFMFIHKVLGLDVPLDRDVIYRQIGMKK